MSTQKTANYQLNQWVKSDRILMEEFNADNLKIDDAIAAVIPTGLICLWSGAADALPAGWALCNGSNGTPDLRGRFLVGAGGSYARRRYRRRSQRNAEAVQPYRRQLGGRSLGLWERQLHP